MPTGMHARTHTMFSPEIRVPWISLVDVEERNLQSPVLMCDRSLSVMLLTSAVALPTPHDYSGALQGGYTARFTASKVLKGARKALYPSKTA